jgi:hypothetical protein
MPSGYTSEIYDGKKITFETFLLQCAKQFGACIMQRDGPFHEPPQLQIPDIEHHENELKILISKKNEINKLSDSQILKNHTILLNKIIKENTKSKLNHIKLRIRYLAMLENVNNWTPPTSDHVNLKNFMIEQLNSSIEWDCNTDYNDKVIEESKKELNEKLKAKIIRHDLITDVDRDIKYHQEQIAKEIQVTNGRNEWISALYNSLNK